MIIEEFRQIFINGEQSNYYIGNNGTVKNIKTKNILKPNINRGGYLYVNLSHNAEVYNCRVHRLVAEAFISKVKDKEIVNHIDGNKLNNNVDNLEWVSSSENNKHAYYTGLKRKPKGRDIKTAKLNDELVNNICILLESGDMSVSEISTQLDVTKSQVEGILYRGLWKHISSNYNIDIHKVKKDYGINKVYRKLTKEDVFKILELHDLGFKNKNIQELLKPIKLSKETIRCICNGKIHRDLFDKYQNNKANKNSSTTIENDEYYTIDIHL